MIAYKDDDIRKYPLCLNFAYRYKDLVYPTFPSSKNTYYKNILNDIKWFYMIKQINESDKAGKKLLEGKIKQIVHFIDHIRLISGKDIKTNEVFDFDFTIVVAQQHLSNYLIKSQDAFEKGQYTFGAFYLGQYFANKEIIKLCKIIKKENQK